MANHYEGGTNRLESILSATRKIFVAQGTVEEVYTVSSGRKERLSSRFA